jgi:hypothetical protein
MSQVTLQGNASGTGVFTIAAPNSNTNRTLNLPDVAGAVIVGTQPAGDIVGTTATQTLTNKSISGAQINSGTVAAARLGSGTPGTGNFLRGDGSWQAVPVSAPTTAQVLTATAGASAEAVGTYAFARRMTTGTSANNSTIAGSSLRWSNANGATQTGYTIHPTLAGTWRCMAYLIQTGTTGSQATGLWLRIS